MPRIFIKSSLRHVNHMIRNHSVQGLELSRIAGDCVQASNI